MAFQINNPETLIVTRDGYLDQEYYDMVYEWKRKEALHAAGRDILHFVTIDAPTLIGKGILSTLTFLAEHADN